MYFMYIFALWSSIVISSIGRSCCSKYDNKDLKEPSNTCYQFSSESGLAKLCGYNSTAHFRYPNHFSMAARAIKAMSGYVGECSPYARDIVCSLYLPRCEPHIRGPFLPCRRVCDEVQQKCAAEITHYGLQLINGMCQLLPREDDPQTTLGYLGRCFEPKNFRTNITVASEPQNLTCHPLVVPICQNLGYTHTVLSPAKQSSYERYIRNELEKHFPGDNNTECQILRNKFFCTLNFPACIDNQLAFFCRDRCFEFFEKNCTSVSSFSKDICIEFPEGISKVDICKQTHWPRAENWLTKRATVTTPSEGDVTSMTSMQTPTGDVTSMTSMQTPTGKSTSSASVKEAARSSAEPVVIAVGVSLIILELGAAYLLYR